MKLSDAIRLGSMLKPQGRGGRMDTERSCALAAACDAVGLSGQRDPILGGLTIPYHILMDRFPVAKRSVGLPATISIMAMGTPLALYEAVYLLNDCAMWTREQIADWVATIEQVQGPRAADVIEAIRVEA